MATDLGLNDYIDQNGDRLLHVAYLLVAGSQAEAEDVLQQLLMKLSAQWRRVSKSRSPDAYVHRMLVNCFMDDRRRAKARPREIRLESLVQQPQRGGSDPAGIVETRDALRGALLQLPDRQRVAVVYRYYQDLDVEEIAELMNIAQATVRSTLTRATAHLRNTLTTEGLGR